MRFLLSPRRDWKHFPLLTHVLGKWVGISAEGMLPLGGVLLELGGAMDNEE